MKNPSQPDIQRLFEFLGAKTPDTWLAVAQDRLPLLLNDHAHCEKKAASTALAFVYRYPERTTLVYRMPKLAREELRHFEQVLSIMKRLAVPYTHLAPSRYAGELRKVIRTHEPARLVDQLIVGAFIEARSCERFAALVPIIPAALAKFYSGLLASEARHFQVYLDLATEYSETDIGDRIAVFRKLEAELILQPDSAFRFHGGPPIGG